MSKDKFVDADLARRLLTALNDAEVARISSLSDEEVGAELVAAGENPSEAAREARERYERIRDGLGLRAIAGSEPPFPPDKPA